ncbi:MAG: tandem-95 repeat protein, partial [Tsuneonella suprasediminis]
PEPVATDDTDTTAEDTPVSGNVLTNDSDPDGDTLSVTSFTVAGDPATHAAGDTVTIAGVGTITIGSTGAYTFTPDANWNGTVPTITYTVSDGEGGSDTADLDITVDPVNDAPITVGTIGDQADADADTITSLDVTSFFDDIDSPTLTYSASGLPAGLTIDPVTGVISGTVDNSASQGGAGGVYSVTVTATDGDGASVDQTFDWTVTNPGPVATDDTNSTNEDTPVSGNVLTNDSDPDGDTLSVTSFTVAGYPATISADTPLTIIGVGTITIGSNGAYTFTPAANWSGTVPTITYTVSDGEGGSDTADLDITVDPVTDLTAADDSATTDEDTPVNGSVAGNDSTTSGGDLTFEKASDPSHGTVVVNPDGTYTYTPDANYNGPDSFTYTVTDPASGETLTRTVDITVNPVNDAPTITGGNQSGGVIEAGKLDDGTPTAGIPDAEGQFLASDVEGDTLTWSVAGTPDTTYGQFSIDASTGEWTYELNNALPATQALNEGDSVELTYTVQVSDGNGGITTRDVVITVTGTNDVPVAIADTDAVTESGVLDGGNTATAGVDTANGSVLTNDSDVDDGETATLTVSEVGFGSTSGTVGSSLSGTYGTLVLSSNGNYVYSLDNTNSDTQALKQGQSVTETFTYTVVDANGASDTSTLTITVTGTNDRPVITSDAAAATGEVIEAGSGVVGDDTATGTLTASDVDTDATQTWSIATTNGTYGTISIDPSTGEWTYTLDNTRAATQALNDGDTETDTFIARVTDEFGAYREQVITINVTGSNDDLTGTEANAVVPLNEDSAATGTLQDYVSDVDDVIELTGFSVDANGDGIAENYLPGATVSLADVDGNPRGTLTIAENGDYTFTPAANYSGTVPTVSYTLAETTGGSGTVSQTIEFEITPVADAPTMEANKTVNTTEDTAQSLGLIVPGITDSGTGTVNGDNPERLGEITLTIGGPGASGVTLSTGATVLTPVGGQITIVLTDVDHVSSVPAENNASGIYYLSSIEYATLAANPTPESGQDFTVTVSATSYEVDGSGAILTGVAGATSTQVIDVDVLAVTDGATLTIDGGNSVNIDSSEDTVIDLSGRFAVARIDSDGASGTDNDGSEQHWYEVSGLPNGTVVTINGVATTISSGTPVAISAASSSLAAPTITINPPRNFSGDLEDVSITLKSRDTDSDSTGTIDTVSSSVDLNLYIAPVAGDVTASNVTTAEDTAVAFLAGVRVTDTGSSAGTEVIDSVAFTVPTDWVVTAPPASAGWSYTLNSGAATITFDDTLTEAQREAILDAFTITPPAHSSADTTIALSITSTDSNTVNSVDVSDTDTVSRNVKITVTPVAERTDTDSDNVGGNDVTMIDDHEYSVAGQEDAWFALGTNYTGTSNTSGGYDLLTGWSNADSDEFTYAVLTPSLASDTPADSVIGTEFRYSTDGGSTWVTQTYVGEPIWVAQQYLDTLQVKLPADVAGTLTVGVQAGTVDYDDDADVATAPLNPPKVSGTGVNVAVSGSATLSLIKFDPVADAVTMALNGRASGVEDSTIPLAIKTTSSDASETFNLTISDIPVGATVTYGTGAGAVTFTSTSGNTSFEIADFSNSTPLSITPPLDSNDDFQLTVSAVSVDGTSTSAPVSRTIDVAVTGVADVATITLPAVEYTTTEAVLDSGNHRTVLSDVITDVASNDGDGSEATTLRITGLAEDFNVVGATMVVSGTGAERVWVVSASNLANVSIETPPNYSGTVGFKVAAVTTENDGDSRTGDLVDVSFTVTPSPEAVITDSATLVEDQVTALNLAIVQQGGDGNETLGQVYIDQNYAVGADYTLYLGGVPIETVGLATTNISGVDYYIVPAGQVSDLGALGAANLDGSLGTLDFLYEVIDPSNDATLAPVTETKPGSLTLSASPVTDPIDASITGINLTTATGSTADNVAGDDALPDTATVTGRGAVVVNMHVDSADIDGSEHLVRILIDGVPDGVTVSGASQIGAGSWLLVYEAGDAISIGSGGIDVPVEFVVGIGAGDGAANITMTALAQDQGQSPNTPAGIQTDTVGWTLNTDLGTGGEFAPPTIDDWSYNGTPGTEDTVFALGDVIDSAVSVADTGLDYSYTVTLTDLPPGSVVTGMILTTIGGVPTWTATTTVPAGGDSQAALDALLDGITVTPPADSNNNNASFAFDAKLMASVVGGPSVEADERAEMPVTPVTDEAAISIAVADVDEGTDSVVATIAVSDPADGAFGQIVDGKVYVQVATTNNDGGTVTDAGGLEVPLTTVTGVAGVPDGDYYVLDVGTDGGAVELTYTAATGDTLVPGDVTFTAIAQTQEVGAANIETASSSGTAVVEIANNGVTVISQPVVGDESDAADKTNAIELSGLSVALNDNDGSETIQSILLAGVPVGFLLYVGNSAGDATLADQASNAGGDGITNTWVLSSDGTLPPYVAILPAPNWSGTLSDLALVVESGETSLDTVRVDTVPLEVLTVNAVANGLTIDPTLSFGHEGSIIDLNLNAAMADAVAASAAVADESTETTTLQLTGLGEFAAFYIGSDLIAGVTYDSATDTYTITGLSQDDLDDLGFVQAESALVDQDNTTAGTQIEVTAWTVESGNGAESAHVSDMMTLAVSPTLATTGNDNLIWDGEAINGRAGTDTVALRYGEDLDHGDLASLLQNVEVLDLSVPGSNSITGGLSISDVLAITGSSTGTLTIDGDAEDSVELSSADDWTTDGIVTNGHLIYTSTSSGVSLSIDEDIHVSYAA